VSVVFIAPAMCVGVVAPKLTLANLLDRSIWILILFAKYATGRTS